MEELKGTKECLIKSFIFYYNNSKFNLLSNLIPLIGPRRLIPIVKTQYLLRKTHF